MKTALFAAILAVTAFTLSGFAQEITTLDQLQTEIDQWRSADGSIQDLRAIYARVPESGVSFPMLSLMSDTGRETATNWSDYAALFSEPTRQHPSLAPEIIAPPLRGRGADWFEGERTPANLAAQLQLVADAGFRVDPDELNLPHTIAVYWDPDTDRAEFQLYLDTFPNMAAHPFLSQIPRKSSQIELSPEEAEAWLLHRRHTLGWHTRTLNNYAKELGILVTGHQGMQAGQAAIAYVQTGDGTDPLADAVIPEMAREKLPLLEDSLTKSLLLGDYAAALDAVKADMATADLAGDARAKKEAALQGARIFFARTGNLAEPNAWLEAVADETWQDYELD
jgi:hypothetical protein